MMRGPGSGWCKMKSPADTVCVAGHIPESPSSSSARQRLRPSARVPPLPPAPGPFAARGAPSRGARRQQGRCGAAAPTPAAPRARPRGRRCGPGRAAQPPRLLRRRSGSGRALLRGSAGPRRPPRSRVSLHRRRRHPRSERPLPRGLAPGDSARAPGCAARGPGQRPGDGDPCSRPRSASPPSRCGKPPPAPRGASASCCCGSCCRDLPRAAGPRAQRPPPRLPRPWPRGQRPPRRASVPAARPLAPRAPRGPGRQAPGPGMSAQQRDRRPRAAAPVRRVPPLRRSPGWGGGGCRDPRWPRRRPAPVSFA